MTARRLSRRRTLALGLWLCAGLLAACAAYTFKGAAYQKPAPAPDFTLTDSDGRSLWLSDLRGSAVLLNFGYTSCPDVCPATLAVARQTFAALGEDARRARFVFVTVDPARDTPDVLRAFLNRFNPGFIGLTGDPLTLAAVRDAYGIVAEIETGAPSDYSVDHTARLYLIDPAGRLRAQYPYGVTADDLRQDIEYALK